MKLPDAVLVSHILYECEKILKLTTSISYGEFENSTTYQDAIIRPLEVIGEAAGNLSGEFLQNHPDIPIANMKGMRNLLAHQYYRVDLETVWVTATNDIPPAYSLLKIISESSEKK
ncbi:DUF86 domain-containing protein [Methanocorpusculum sp. MG]|uniref:DUF86 domain-containing protein n=1 Tax=Methanocorpusculum petauri TaxID=3002863 RepID=A0ABT4IEI5_9EURY|nr:DUF86 domain-containing protein [Methanocorpusculum petauri]MCZ0860154.1 DUF86 domain-containing protein [Methanocorpusculum petauri]MCZ9313327.1 DUF86 domain-containing protein [Methanocorpusculum sp.]